MVELPDTATPAELWAEIHRLQAAMKGPDGFATWQEAAIAERTGRVKAEAANAKLLTALDGIQDVLQALKAQGPES